jgi:pimeloyl-ACP methyl ester carboxylesterase
MLEKPQSGKIYQFSNTVLINYEEEGTGDKTVIFLHGFAASLQYWKSLRERLTVLPCRRFFLDLKGFGFSSKPDDKQYSALHQAEIVNGFITYHNLNNVTLIGHSYGGGVAIITYLMLKDVSENNPIKKLVLIDGAWYMQKIPLVIAYVNVPVLKTIVKYLVPNRIVARYSLQHVYYNSSLITPDKINTIAYFMSLPGSSTALAYSVHQLVPENYTELKDKLQMIDVPVLIIWGENDRIIPVKNAYRFKNDIPHAEQMILPECGHIPHQEKPDETYSAIARFVNR